MSDDRRRSRRASRRSCGDLVADPRAARHRAERAPVVDRGAAADAAQQPRPRGRGAARRAVVYGGSGRAARNHEALRAIVGTLLELGPDETLLVQSGKPVGVFTTHEGAPRVLIANSLLVPKWATWDEFRRLEARADDVRPDDGRLVDLHRHAGDPAGHVPDVRRGGRAALRHRRPRGADDPHGGARRDGRRAAACGDDGRRGDPLHRGRSARGSSGGSRRATSTRRPTRSTTRSRASARRRRRDARSRSGCSGTRPSSCPSSRARGEHFDLVTDQTAAHDPLNGYVPRGPFGRGGGCAARVRSGRVPAARARVDRAHVEGMLEYVRRGRYVFDYGNNLRGEAREAGVAEAFSYPGFVPAYIRPLFCRGIGPFRWAALSGDPADIAAIDHGAAGALPRRPAPAAVARARTRAGGVPGPARPDLLARLRRPREGGARDERARPQRRGQGADRHRARPPRRRLRRVAVPRDGGDARRLRRDRRLADPERARSTSPRERRG